MPALHSPARVGPLTLLIALAALTACAAPQASQAAANPPGCVEDYDPTTDYFPHEASFAHATGVSVTYSDNTKLVEIGRPYKDADESFRALLVQCGTPAPDGVEADVTVEVPVRAAATFSTTQLPSFAMLDKVDAIVAHGGLQYASTPEVVAAADAGQIVEVGDQTEPDVETLVAADPDVALLSAGIDGDAHRNAVAAVGVPAIPYADWLEESLLGRAEWLKVVALLTNAEQEATAEFAAIEDATQEIIARAETQSTRPKVVLGAPFEGTWYMPAGDSYVAEALTSLGAEYPWAATEGTGALSLDLETVVARAADADVWLGAGSVHGTLAELAASDERFSAFEALRSGNVFAEDLKVNEDGGNALFELGAVRPDLLLGDLFAMLYPAHPDAGDLTFYGRVGSERERG
jgi:iron complex transport system substrate-binding protein